MFFSSAPSPPLPAPRRGLEALYADPLPWLLALAAMHVAVRVSVSSALKIDEAQQILWSQHLQWGYGAQPPLYTWLQWGMNQVFGPSVLSLTLLKQALIALVCAFMWLAARELMGRRAAWWSAASLWLLPPFGWYPVRDQTHTVLVTTMTCAAWWLLLRVVRSEGVGCRRQFAALGVVCGCGLLAKYNFALMLAAFIIALLSVREPRQALFGRGWWWAPLIALIVVAPHGAWLLSHWHDATAATVRQMAIAPESRWGAGVGNLLRAILGTLAPWGTAALLAFGSGWRRHRAPERASMPEAAAWLRPVFGRYLVLIAAALLALVLVTGVTVFKGRWLLPLLAPVPLMAFALRPELDADPRGKRLVVMTLALLLVMLAFAAARPWKAAITGSVDALNYPAVQLAQALQNAGYDGRGRIIAADDPLAGMLRTRFPAAPAAACDRHTENVATCVPTHVQQAERGDQGWLLISRAERDESAWWSQALPGVPGSDTLPRGHLRLPYRMVRRGHPLASYHFIWHPYRAP
ncbi:MAG: glycosyltransferase family 39 protein [Burkholderiaceae bacterium]|jgi:4-amino-4-deoxy-L-arabinose transferase-like glycosyltransferase|nr:glycosyltransferase family 39 protein [Burkholderiaceae bacterium]